MYRGRVAFGAMQGAFSVARPPQRRSSRSTVCALPELI